MRSIKLRLMGRQRPLQFSYDCGASPFPGSSPRYGYLTFDDQLELARILPLSMNRRNVRPF